MGDPGEALALEMVLSLERSDAVGVRDGALASVIVIVIVKSFETAEAV